MTNLKALAQDMAAHNYNLQTCALVIGHFTDPDRPLLLVGGARTGKTFLANIIKKHFVIELLEELNSIDMLRLKKRITETDFNNSENIVAVTNRLENSGYRRFNVIRMDNAFIKPLK